MRKIFLFKKPFPVLVILPSLSRYKGWTPGRFFDTLSKDKKETLMFFKRNTIKVLAKMSIFAFLFTGVFSFCFAHEVSAHDDQHSHEEQFNIGGEIHDNHCNFDIASDKLLPYPDFPFQKFFSAILFSGDTSINWSLFTPDSPSTLARGRPPSPQPQLLQVFRC